MAEHHNFDLNEKQNQKFLNQVELSPNKKASKMHFDLTHKNMA